MRRLLSILVSLLPVALVSLACFGLVSLAAPAPAAARVTVVTSGHYASGSSLHVIGLLRNTTGTPQQDVQVFVSLYDKKHKLVGGQTGTPKLPIVLAHGSVPFDLEIPVAPSDVASVAFKVTGDPVGQLVQVLSQQVSSSSGSSVTLTGSIQNVSHSRVYVSSVAAAAFDGAGHIVDVGSNTYDLPTLQPSAIGSFSVSFTHAAGATRYAVYAQGTPES